MAATPDQMRADIENTRAELAGDVNALTEKASPRQMTRRRAEAVRRTASGLRDRVMGSAQETTGSVRDAAGSVREAAGSAGETAKDTAQAAPAQVRQQTQGNPLAAGLIAFGAGLLAASLAPVSEAERHTGQRLKVQAEGLTEPAKQALGESAQQIKDTTTGAARHAADEVTQTATEAAQTTKEQAKQSGQRAGEQAKEHGAQAREQLRENTRR